VISLSYGVLSGQRVWGSSIDEVLGKKTLRPKVVVFMSSQCPCSKSHALHLKDLAARFKSNFDFYFVFSNADETHEQNLSYAKELGLNAWPVVPDPHQKLADKLGALRTPHAFVLKPDQSVAFQGGVSDSHVFEKSKVHTLENALLEVRDQKPITVKESRLLGCEIARE